MPVPDAKPPAERLLDAADLFYRDGVAAVGVSRLIEEAGVAQMGLWRAFGSKDGLVEAWLRRLDERLLAEMVAIADDPGPRPAERIMALFDVVAERCLSAGFQGCPLNKATAELGPATAAGAIAVAHKDAVRRIVARLAAEAGADDPEALGLQLFLLMEGAFAAAALRPGPAPASEAKAAAKLLLASAVRRASRRVS